MYTDLQKALEDESFSAGMLWEHLLDHSPISDCQWGFQKQKSTTTALLFTTQEWLKFLDRKQEVICVYFDYIKAFDSVPQRKLWRGYPWLKQ